MTIATPAGMEIKADIKPGYEQILTPEALDLVAKLSREFEPRRQQLLAARVEPPADHRRRNPLGPRRRRQAAARHHFDKGRDLPELAHVPPVRCAFICDKYAQMKCINVSFHYFMLNILDDMTNAKLAYT